MKEHFMKMDWARLNSTKQAHNLYQSHRETRAIDTHFCDTDTGNDNDDEAFYSLKPATLVRYSQRCP